MSFLDTNSFINFLFLSPIIFFILGQLVLWLANKIANTKAQDFGNNLKNLGKIIIIDGFLLLMVVAAVLLFQDKAWTFFFHTQEVFWIFWSTFITFPILFFIFNRKKVGPDVEWNSAAIFSVWFFTVVVSALVYLTIVVFILGYHAISSYIVDVKNNILSK
jgi:hypothetical protein